MKNSKKLLAMILAMSAGCSSNRHGWNENKVELNAAPASVQKAITSAVGTGKLEKVKKENEDGKTVYEAEFEVANVDHSVTVTETGEVIEEETEVEAKTLPPAVTNAVKAKYATAEIEEANLVKAGGKTFYEVDVEIGKEHRELKIDAAGTITADKVEHEHQDGDHDGDHDGEHDKKDGDMR